MGGRLREERVRHVSRDVADAVDFIERHIGVQIRHRNITDAADENRPSSGRLNRRPHTQAVFVGVPKAELERQLGIPRCDQIQSLSTAG